MDGALFVVWTVRILFLVLLYVVLFRIVATLVRDLRAAAREPGTALGRVVVVESPGGEPAVGRSFDLDSITTLGRDVNNAIVIDDPFASADHAILTYRGRSWYVEDAGSTNGTQRNGRPISGPSPLGFGDEVGIGQVRLRLERPRGG
jgi:FHA domain